MSTRQAQAAVAATVGAHSARDATPTAGSLDIEDDAHLLNAGHGMRLAGAVKLAAWNASHGAGICDVEIETESHPAAGRSVADVVAEIGLESAAVLFMELIGAIPAADVDASFEFAA